MPIHATTPRPVPRQPRGHLWLALGVAALVSACGADGAPTKPGVSVTGEARVGITNTN